METLTEAEFGNVPWDRTVLIGLHDPVLFQCQSTDLSERLLGFTHVWLNPALFQSIAIPFAMGTHTSVGEASILRMLAGQPEILGMIAEFVTN
jgi:hypothetical protein